MRWTALPVIAVALLSTARATEPPPVDTEFLEYLGSLEDGDDNWTVVAGDKVRPKSTAAKPVPTSQQSTAPPTSASTPPPVSSKKPEPKT
jgi:hypothetical protein